MMNMNSCVPMPSTKIEIGTMVGGSHPKHVDYRPSIRRTSPEYARGLAGVAQAVDRA